MINNEDMPLTYIVGRYDNIYYRTCKQLEQFLVEHSVPVKYVSRSSVGDYDYYNLKFELPLEKWVCLCNSSTLIARLLNIKNVGVVYYFKYNDTIHEVILIDENELNSKYLKDGNLVFK